MQISAIFGKRKLVVTIQQNIRFAVKIFPHNLFWEAKYI